MKQAKTTAYQEAAGRLSLWLVDRALQGARPLISAQQLAEQYRADASHPHDEARIAALVRWEVSKNFTAGFISNIGGVLTMPIAIPSGLGATWLLQARLAAAVASLRGYDLDDPATQSMVLLSLTGAASPNVLKAAGIRAGEMVTRTLLARMSEEMLININRRVGFSLIATAGERGLLNLAKAAPLVGAVVAGTFDAYNSRHVAHAAKTLFPIRKLLPPARR